MCVLCVIYVSIWEHKKFQNRRIILFRNFTFLLTKNYLVQVTLHIQIDNLPLFAISDKQYSYAIYLVVFVHMYACMGIAMLTICILICNVVSRFRTQYSWSTTTKNIWLCKKKLLHNIYILCNQENITEVIAHLIHIFMH